MRRETGRSRSFSTPVVRQSELKERKCTSEVISMTVEDLKAFPDAFNRHEGDGMAGSFTEDGAFGTVRENRRITGKAKFMV